MAELGSRRADGRRRAVVHRATPGWRGHDLVLGNCLICHSSMMLEQQHKDSTAWNKTVTTMVSWGAPVPPAQQPVLVTYLAQHFAARVEGAPARPAS